MQYCILVWGSTYLSNLYRIVLLQKRIIRIVDKSAYDAHTEPIFRKLKIFPFDKIYSFHLGKFMYLYYKVMLPPSFNNFFLCVNSFSSGRKLAILGGVVLNAYIFQTIHRTETEIASFERGGLPLSNDTNFNFIPSLVNDLLA